MKTKHSVSVNQLNCIIKYWIILYTHSRRSWIFYQKKKEQKDLVLGSSSPVELWRQTVVCRKPEFSTEFTSTVNVRRTIWSVRDAELAIQELPSPMLMLHSANPGSNHQGPRIWLQITERQRCLTINQHLTTNVWEFCSNCLLTVEKTLNVFTPVCVRPALHFKPVTLGNLHFSNVLIKSFHRSDCLLQIQTSNER